MKFKINVEDLANILPLLGSSVGINVKDEGSIPLTYIYASLNAGSLELITTNKEVITKFTVQVVSADSGKFLIPYRIFTDFIKTLNEGEITIDVSIPVMKIKSSSGTVRISIFDSSIFPDILDKYQEKKSITVKMSLLRNALATTSPVQAMTVTKPTLCGTYLFFKDNYLYMVATDTFRVAILKEPYEHEDEIIGVLPRDVITMLNLASKIINDDDDITLSYTSTSFYITSGDVSIIFRKIGGQYPDIMQIFNFKMNAGFLVNASVFEQAIKQVQLFSKHGLDKTTLTIDFAASIIKMSSEQVAFGDGQFSLPIEVVENSIDRALPQSLEIVINCNYILQGLRLCNTKNALIRCGSPLSPIYINRQNNENYFHMIMPMR